MSFLSDKASKLIPYVPGEQPKDGKYIKLNTNENPYPPSPKVIEAIKAAVGESLRLYPDPESTALRRTYAEYLGLEGSNIFVGNGSDEVLAIAFQAFFSGRKNVFMPDISYSFYPVYCKLYDVEPKICPLKEDFTVDTTMYVAGEVQKGGIVIANPNAPSSIALGTAEIENVLKNNSDCVVLVDEAYVDFGAESAVSLISKYDNLLVVTTLSKSRSLAGLRVGFAAGSKKLIEGMSRVKNSVNSYPIDLLAQKGAEAAIKDIEYFNETRNKIISTRDLVSSELEKLGFDVLPSCANFIFAENKRISAKSIFQRLKENMILVRYFDLPRIDNRLRVSIGTQAEMEKFIEVMRGIVIK